MRLWIGLGNPGDAYAEHRHNAGFMALDALRDAFNAGPEEDKFFGRFSVAVVAGEKLLFLRPMTYMNRSGIAAAAAAGFYKVPLDKVSVLHDDLDLALGDVRTKVGGGHGGHNGLKSLDAHLGADYRRVRIGIGHPGHRDRVDGWVLGRFAPEQRACFDAVLSELVACRSALLDHTFTRFTLP